MSWMWFRSCRSSNSICFICSSPESHTRVSLTLTEWWEEQLILHFDRLRRTFTDIFLFTQSQKQSLFSANVFRPPTWDDITTNQEFPTFWSRSWFFWNNNCFSSTHWTSCRQTGGEKEGDTLTRVARFQLRKGCCCLTTWLALSPGLWFSRFRLMSRLKTVKCRLLKILFRPDLNESSHKMTSW